MKLRKKLGDNLAVIKKRIGSDDVSFMEFKIHGKNAVLVFVNDIVNKEAAGELILRPLSELECDFSPQVVANNIFSPEKKEVLTVEETVDEIMTGNVCLLVDGTAESF